MAYRSLVSSKYFIHFLTYLLATRRLQITHCALHVTVTKPLLYGLQINASPQAPSCERRTKFVQPEFSFWRLARSATAFRQSRKSSFGQHPLVGKTKPQVLSDFALCAFRLVTSLAGIGISRSR